MGILMIKCFAHVLIAELAKNASATWVGLTCSDDIVPNILKYVCITIVFFLTLAPNKPTREWCVTSLF